MLSMCCFFLRRILELGILSLKIVITRYASPTIYYISGGRQRVFECGNYIYVY